MDQLCILIIILPLSTVANIFYCNNSKITGFGIIDSKDSSTTYVLIFRLITKCFLLEQEEGSLITPMVLAHPLHPIGCRSRNKCPNLWFRWCVPPDDVGSGPYSIGYLSNGNKVFLWDIYIQTVGVATTMCWMIWYCYFFWLGFKCISQLYDSAFSISWYGYRYHVTLCIGQLHSSTMCSTGFGVCVVLVLSVIMCSFY